MKIRFGKGPHAILILAYINNDIYEWVGSDDVRIYTYQGRIIQTTGLPHNFEIKKFRDDVIPNTMSSMELVNLYNPLKIFSFKFKLRLMFIFFIIQEYLIL